MITWILAVLGLWLGQVFFAASFKTVLVPEAQAASMDHMRGKDMKVEPSITGKRAIRAQNNMLESMIVFLPLAVLLEVKGAPGMSVTGAMVFFVGRLLYVPAYLVAVFGLRTAMWSVGAIGLAIMAWELFNA